MTFNFYAIIVIIKLAQRKLENHCNIALNSKEIRKI